MAPANSSGEQQKLIKSMTTTPNDQKIPKEKYHTF